MNAIVNSSAELNTKRSADVRSFDVAVIGLGYVGLPLVHAFWRSGLKVLGLDIDPVKVERLRSGESYIAHFDAPTVQAMNSSGRFIATTDESRLADADAILICVPTPVTATREPDLRFVSATAQSIARQLRPGTLVVLESTTYPGTTNELVLPILEASGLKAGRDFQLAFSPEREDPGSGIRTSAVPKIVGGIDAASTDRAAKLYATAFDTVHKVRDAQTAEAVKITENVFRAVNIALANELKTIYSRMGIDVWEVIEAAKTKPYGYMAFYPGPGLGGHCIPIDPFYLSWRARAYDIDARFIELAGEVNRAMPRLVLERLAEGLNIRRRRALNGSRVLVIGAAYKKDIDDTRESPALRLLDLLAAQGADIAYHDPFVPEIPATREHPRLAGMRSVAFDEVTLSSFDAVLIATDHSCIDYDALVRWSTLVVDTRNATREVAEGREKILMA